MYYMNIGPRRAASKAPPIRRGAPADYKNKSVSAQRKRWPDSRQARETEKGKERDTVRGSKSEVARCIGQFA